MECGERRRQGGREAERGKQTSERREGRDGSGGVKGRRREGGGERGEERGKRREEMSFLMGIKNT